MTRAGEPAELRAVLISASLGGGHLKAMEALGGALEREAPGLNALEVDYLSYLNPVQLGLSLGVYRMWLEHSPATYRYFYHWSNRASAPRAVKYSSSTAGLPRLLRDLRRARPQLVISSYDAPAALADTARRRRGLRFLNALLVTDYSAHYHWARHEADVLLVATDRVRAQLIGWGIAPEKIAVTGIPIVSRVPELIGADKAALRAHFGLRPDEPLVLVSGGGQGSIYHATQEVVDACAAVGARVQVLLLAGVGNLGTEQVGGATIHRLGYTRFFPELLAASDLVIGKAGGLTVAEATTLGVPMLVYAPIPGQEEANAAYLQENGAAVWAHSKWEVRRHLARLLGDSPARAQMSAAASRLGRPHAARDAARELLSRLGGQG